MRNPTKFHGEPFKRGQRIKHKSDLPKRANTFLYRGALRWSADFTPNGSFANELTHLYENAVTGSLYRIADKDMRKSYEVVEDAAPEREPKFLPGDRVRFNRLTHDGIRVNGALDLTVKFYGADTVVYEWVSPGNGHRGEVTGSREEFDRDYERLPDEGVLLNGPDADYAPTVQIVNKANEEQHRTRMQAEVDGAHKKIDVLTRRIERMDKAQETQHRVSQGLDKRIVELATEYHMHKHIGSGPGQHG